MEILEKRGDLFSSSHLVALAHCVSADFKMGAGIALDFRNKFGNADKLLETKCQVGQVATLQFSDRAPIYYLVTKDRYFGKPTYDTLESALENLAKCCQRDKIAHLAMPRIGTGLDQLSWDLVKPLIVAAFKGSNVKTITVFKL
jgi:O-acetyl-ADP-ribose deacetylase (regulator of RNase III)